MSEEPKPRACAWCGATFRPGTIGRAAVYCRRGCRQRAYEARREARRIAEALAAAAAAQSRDGHGLSDSPRDESGSGGAVPAARRTARRALGPGVGQPTLDDAADDPPAEPSLLPHEVFRRLPPGLG